MRFGIMWWWLIPLLVFLVAGRRRRWGPRRGGGRSAGGEVAELRRVVDGQRGYIEELEGRLARVEDGLEFAERLLAGRGTSSGTA